MKMQKGVDYDRSQSIYTLGGNETDKLDTVEGRGKIQFKGLY